jgi:hypothetical protein
MCPIILSGRENVIAFKVTIEKDGRTWVFEDVPMYEFMIGFESDGGAYLHCSNGAIVHDNPKLRK